MTRTPKYTIRRGIIRKNRRESLPTSDRWEHELATLPYSSTSPLYTLRKYPRTLPTTISPMDYSHSRPRTPPRKPMLVNHSIAGQRVVLCIKVNLRTALKIHVFGAVRHPVDLSNSLLPGPIHQSRQKSLGGARSRQCHPPHARSAVFPQRILSITQKPCAPKGTIVEELQGLIYFTSSLRAG